jgi:molybdenum cofactor guanylyltransferase
MWPRKVQSIAANPAARRIERARCRHSCRGARNAHGWWRQAASARERRADPQRFEAFGLPVIADSAGDFPGPLAGILAGLDWAASEGFSGDVLSVPGDCPFIPHDLAEKLEAARRSANLPLACAGSGGWTHPVIGLWPVSIREELRAALAGGERKIDRFTARFGCAIAEWPTEPIDPFFNVNTPEEWEEAERIATLAGSR